METRIVDETLNGLAIGQPMELAHRALRRPPHHLRVPPGARVSAVHIVGAGIHPFGRTDGRSGRDQGVFAVRQALADAGLEWPDVQAAYGGSSAAGSADIMVGELGADRPPLHQCRQRLRHRRLRLGRRVRRGGERAGRRGAGGRVRQTPARILQRRASRLGPAGVVRPGRADAHHPILRAQDPALPPPARHQPGDVGRVAAKAFRNGARAEHAWRRTPVDLDTILDSPTVNDPLTKYMFCSPAEGGAALILASERKARELGADSVRVAGVAMRSRPAGSFEVFAPSVSVERGDSPTRLASRAAYEAAGIGPADVALAQLQDTESGAEIMHMAGERLLLGRRAGGVDRRGPHRTDGRSARQHGRGLPGLRRAHRSVRPAPGL